MSASPATGRGPRPWLVLALLAVAAVILGWLCYRVAAPSLAGWYTQLAKPAIAPPAGVFVPLWAALHLLMGLAAWRIACSDAGDGARNRALRAFWIQLALVFAWIVIFFGARDPGWAFVEIPILLAALIVAVMRFAAIDRRAGWLLLPQLGWTVFATLLNFLIWKMNLKP